MHHKSYMVIEIKIQKITYGINQIYLWAASCLTTHNPFVTVCLHCTDLPTDLQNGIFCHLFCIILLNVAFRDVIIN